MAGPQADAAQALLVGVGEDDLADGGGGLLLVEALRPALQPELAPAERDGAGGDDDRLLAAGDQLRHVGREPVEPGLAHLAVLVDQQRAADLDHDAPGVERVGRPHHAVSAVRSRRRSSTSFQAASSTGPSPRWATAEIAWTGRPAASASSA